MRLPWLPTLGEVHDRTAPPAYVVHGPHLSAAKKISSLRKLTKPVEASTTTSVRHPSLEAAFLLGLLDLLKHLRNISKRLCFASRRDGHTFNNLVRAPFAATPFAVRPSSSSATRSCQFMSLRLSVYLWSRSVRSQFGMSRSSAISVGSSGGLELPRRPRGDLPRLISLASDR